MQASLVAVQREECPPWREHVKSVGKVPWRYILMASVGCIDTQELCKGLASRHCGLSSSC